MLIKPFKSLKDVADSIETIRSISTTIDYIPSINDNGVGRLVISRKYLIKNFTSKNSLSFVKVVYCFIHKFKEPKLTNDNIRQLGELDLQYVTTSVYDSDENHYFGNTVYDTTIRSSQVVHKIFDMTQNLSDMCYGEDSYHLEYEGKQIYFVEIIQDEIKDGCKLGLSIGVCPTYQLSSEYRIRKYRRINEFLRDSSIRINSYDGYLKNKIDSFSETSLLKMSQEITTKSLSEVGTLSLVKSTRANELLVIKDVMDRVLSDLIKVDMLSLLDNISFIYDKGKISITNVEYPFDKILVSFLERVVLMYKKHIEFAMQPAEDILGNFKMIININNLYSMCFIRLNEESMFTTIDFKDEIIRNYIFNNCKSKRYRKTHMSNMQKNEATVNEMFDYFDDDLEYNFG